MIMINKNSKNNANKKDKGENRNLIRNSIKVMKTLSIFLLFLTLLFSSTALIASIGNAVMVIHTTVYPGKITTVDKTILVRNVNSIPVNVTLILREDMEKIVSVKDKNFFLQPNESKDARITIRVANPGVYEGQIIVLFQAREGANNATSNVALASSIIVDAALNSTSGSGASNTNSTNSNNQNTNIYSNANGSSNDSNSNTNTNKNNSPSFRPDLLVGLIIVVALAIIGLVIFLIILKRR